MRTKDKSDGRSHPTFTETARRAIDAVAPLLAAHPTLDTDAYAQELVTLFDRATRKE